MFQLKTHRTHRVAPHWENHFLTEQPARRVVYKTHTLPYNRHQLADSVYQACMKAFGYVGEAEDTAVRVCQHVEDWLIDKEEVTKADITRQAARALQQYNPRAAYEYAPSKQYHVTQDEYGFVRL